MSSYRCQATSVAGFVQVLACNYLPHGYWFYVAGIIPEAKDPEKVDRKLIDKYGIAVSRQGRVRRKHAGLANLHYLRFGRFWLLLATHGKHQFFESEEMNIRDARKTPIQFNGYAISVKRGGHLRKEGGEAAVADTRLRVRVQIAREPYRELKACFLEIAIRRSMAGLGQKFFEIPFEPYAPVRQQMLNILRLVNQARQTAGLDRVPPSVLRFHRQIVKPFEAEAERRSLPDDRRVNAELLAANPGALEDEEITEGGTP